MNADLARLCRAAQRATERHGKDLELQHIILAILEEMKQNSAGVSRSMIAALRREFGDSIGTRELKIASFGLFGIIAAYKGSTEDKYDE